MTKKVSSAKKLTRIGGSIGVTFEPKYLKEMCWEAGDLLQTEYDLERGSVKVTKLFAKLEAPVAAIKKLSKEDQVMAFLLSAGRPMHVLKIRNLLNISAEATEEVVKRLIDAQKVVYDRASAMVSVIKQEISESDVMDEIGEVLDDGKTPNQ